MDLKAQDLEKEVEELRALLSAANSRVEEKDLVIFEMEEKVEKMQSHVDSNGKSTITIVVGVQKPNDSIADHAKWNEKKANDQQLADLNDEIETLKEEKRKLNSQLVGVAGKDEEIAALEKEVKNLMKVISFLSDFANGSSHCAFCLPLDESSPNGKAPGTPIQFDRPQEAIGQQRGQHSRLGKTAEAETRQLRQLADFSGIEPKARRVHGRAQV